MTEPIPEGAKISCKDVARLLSDAQDQEVAAGERVRLRLHLAICEACRNLEQQFDFIRRAMRRLGKEDGRRD